MRFFFFVFLLTLSLNTSAQISKVTANPKKINKLVYSSLDNCKKENKSLSFLATPSYELKVTKALSLKTPNSIENKKYILLEPIRMFSKNIPSKEFVEDQAISLSFIDEFKLINSYFFVEIFDNSIAPKEGDIFIASLDLKLISGDSSDNQKQYYTNYIPSKPKNAIIYTSRINGTACALTKTKENIEIVQKNYSAEIQPFDKNICKANKWIHRKDFNYLEDDDASLRFEAKGYTSFMVRLQNSKYISFQSSESPQGNSNIWYNINSIDCQNGFLEYQASGYEGGGASLLDLLNGTFIHNTESSYFFWLQDKKYFLKGVPFGLIYTDPSKDGLSLWDCSQRNTQKSCVKVWEDPEFAKLRYVIKLIRNQGREAEFKIQVVTKRVQKTVMTDNLQPIQISNLLIDEYKVTCYLNSPVKCEKRLVNSNIEIMEHTTESEPFKELEEVPEEGFDD